jgi:DNA-binding response OmpR family regulator
MLRLLNRTLELEGFDTIIVADEDSALNQFNEVEPDLVILDENLSGNDSIKVIDQLREHSSVPIIILSNGYKIESLRQALSHGADDFIRKPFGMRSFIARIRAKLRRIG